MFGLQGNFSVPTSYFVPILLMNANSLYVSVGKEKIVANCF